MVGDHAGLQFPEPNSAPKFGRKGRGGMGNLKFFR
jgi:hypothetical protein